MPGPLLLQALTAAAKALSLESGYRLADFLSSGHRRLFPCRRRAVGRNVAALRGGDDELTPLVRSVFRNYGRFLFEFLRGPAVPEVPVRFERLEVLETALARGRGAVVALLHTGNFEITGARLAAANGARIHAVAATQLRGAWTEELRRRQEAAGIRILPPTHRSRREMVALLARNEILALLVDGDVFRRGIAVSFCGQAVSLPAGPARLAAVTGAALVPSYCLRLADGVLEQRFLDEVGVKDRSSASVCAATRELSVRLGEVLRAHPDQWMIFRDFFAQAAA
jgi:KDO2-lipid IV(A) lauroyltransferase